MALLTFLRRPAGSVDGGRHKYDPHARSLTQSRSRSVTGDPGARQNASDATGGTSTAGSDAEGHRTLPRSLRAAVVGTGAISSEHLTFLAGRSPFADAVADRVTPVAVCDLSPAAARYAAETYGIAAYYTDLEQMLHDEQPDVIHILTPPSTHIPLATMCLEAGTHVICEKPVATNIDDLETLLAVADRAGRRVSESHNYCFNPAVTELTDLLVGGTLGELREVEVRIVLPVTDPDGRFADPNLPHPIHDLPAGVIHDFTTHFASLLLHLSGNITFDRVAAAWSNHSDSSLFRYDNLDALLIGDGPDGPIHARLRFDAGAGPDTFAITVRGSRGWAEIDLFQPNTRLVVPRAGGSHLSPIANHMVNGAGLLRSGVANIGRKIMQQTPYEGLHLMLAATYDALIAGDEPPVGNDNMRAVARLVDQLLEEKARI